MAGARVESLDAIKAFRLSLFKFAEAATVALGDAESEIQRTLRWLETEQLTFWQGQIRKRTEMLARAQDVLRQKTLYKDAVGRTQSVVDEMKIVTQCKRRLDEANQKLSNVKVYTRRLQKELEMYKGTVQRFATTVQSEVPVNAARLERMLATLQAYTELTVDDVSSAALGQFSGEISRGATQAAGYGKETAPARAVEQALPSQEAIVALRTAAPAADLVEGATPGFVPTSGWKLYPVRQGDRDALKTLTAERDEPKPSHRIIVRRGAVESGTIYLERITRASAEDSGWYVAPVATQEGKKLGNPDPNNFQAMRVSDLLAVRPDFTEILSLGRGYLVVLSGGAIANVLDPQDHDLWKSIEPLPARITSLEE